VNIESTVSDEDHRIHNSHGYSELDEFVGGEVISENDEIYAYGLYLIANNETQVILNARNVHSIRQGTGSHELNSIVSSTIWIKSDEPVEISFQSAMGYSLGLIDVDAYLFFELADENQNLITYFADNYGLGKPEELIELGDLMLLPPGEYFLRAGSALSALPLAVDSNAVADVGIAIFAVPEPSTLVLMAVFGVCISGKSSRIALVRLQRRELR